MNKSGKQLYEFPPFLLDEPNGLLLRDGQAVRLTPKAFETLLVLVRNHGCVIEKNRLLNEVWLDSFVEEGSLSRNIHERWKALGDDSGRPHYIETLPRRGYRFVALVNKVQDPPAHDAPRATQPAADAAGTTLVEKHTFARIFTEEETVPVSPVTENEAEVKHLGGAQGSRCFWHSRRAILFTALIVAGLLSLAAYFTFFWPVRKASTLAPAPGNVHRLTDNYAADQQPRWSPDGFKLAFQTDRDGNW